MTTKQEKEAGTGDHEKAAKYHTWNCTIGLAVS